MSYLLDKKTQRNNSIRIIVLTVFIFVLIYFRAGIFNGLSTASHVVFRPVWFIGNSISGKLEGINAFFDSKRALLLENEDLKSKLSQMEGRVSNYNSLLADDASIKEILGRKSEKIEMILAGILSKPNQSIYDTIIVDAGSNQSVSVGALVFADGNVPVGRVDSVYPNSSKIILFSDPSEQTQVLISSDPKQDVFMQVIGRGGGNFEMILPRDLNLEKGAQVVLPGITPYVVGTVETIISDPRDAFKKALLVSPTNVEMLKFVEIQK